MSWSKWAFVPKFDYTIGNYNGFWQESEVNYFVDSVLGLDTNAGTAAAPFKTLSKVKSLGAGIWEDGLVIFANGTFNENLVIDKAVRIVGCGGDNGRCVFEDTGGLFVTNSNTNVTFDNVYVNYSTSREFIGFYSSNSFLKKAWLDFMHSFYLYNVNLYESTYPSAAVQGGYIYGRNISFVNCSSMYNSNIRLEANNITTNNDIRYNIGTGTNRLVNTDARYFTDDTETTPAQLLIDPINGNFNFKKDVYIWDKTAGAYITINPLFETGTFNDITQKNNHIGAGYESTSYNGLNSIFIDTSQGGTATYTNIQVDGSGYLSRINDGIDGSVLSGIGDLGKIVKGANILLPQVFITTKRILTTTPSIRVIQDIRFRWGKTCDECNNADWCFIEYGKPIYYSMSGTTRIGNADPNFDVANSIIAEFEFFQFEINFKNI